MLIKKQTFMLALGLFVLMANVPYSYAGPKNLVLDQQQTVIDLTIGGLTIGGQSNQKLAQVVIAGISGKLAAISLPVACEGGGVTFQIRSLIINGVPSENILAQKYVSAKDLQSVYPDPPVFRTITFGNPVHLQAGDQFAIVLLSKNGDCGVFEGPTGNLYPGELFYDALPDSGWFAVSDGRDLPFQTFMLVP